MHKAALTAIAVQASADDIDDLRQVFISLDLAGEGYISFDQLKKGLGTLESNSETLLSIFKAVDTDQSGFIDYTEFLAASLPRSLYLREDYLKSAFNMFDRDGSGKIDMVELAQILEGEEKRSSMEEIKMYIKKIDVNGDGLIDYDEFKQMMEKCG